VTTKPDPAAVMAALETLTNKLCDSFGAKGDRTHNMQDRYEKALTAVAFFLDRSGIDEDIANRFIELASAIRNLRRGTVVDFLSPAVVSGRSPDPQEVWILRLEVILGLECILRSQEMNIEV
jgi:hypothetical protein